MASNGMTDETTQRLNRAQHGDVQAFAELIEPMRATLVRVAAGMVGDADAEDVVLESLLRVWRALPTFRQRAALRTWVIRIVRNGALDRLRHRARLREVPLEPADEDETNATPRQWADPNAVEPVETMVLAERQRAVARALERLETPHRQVLELRYMDDLSYQEIATALSLSIGTVMSRLFYGKRKLARLLEESEEVRP